MSLALKNSAAANASKDDFAPPTSQNIAEKPFLIDSLNSLERSHLSSIS